MNTRNLRSEEWFQIRSRSVVHFVRSSRVPIPLHCFVFSLVSLGNSVVVSSFFLAGSANAAHGHMFKSRSFIHHCVLPRNLMSEVQNEICQSLRRYFTARTDERERDAPGTWRNSLFAPAGAVFHPRSCVFYGVTPTGSEMLTLVKDELLDTVGKWNPHKKFKKFKGYFQNSLYDWQKRANCGG